MLSLSETIILSIFTKEFKVAAWSACLLNHFSLVLNDFREFSLAVWYKYQLLLFLACGCSHCGVESEVSDAVRCVWCIGLVANQIVAVLSWTTYDMECV